jgi:redox-sensitive bicupin YhaK (pirin superfamily)
MEKLSPGQIFLADQRGIAENEISRCFSSFNYGHYINESRKPFGLLEVFNDEILAAGKSVSITIQNTCYLVLIPITGALLSANAQHKTTVTDVGEVFISYVAAGGVFELTNPYPNDWVNFLCIQVKAKPDAFPFFDQTFNFDFAGKQNELIGVVPGYAKLPFSIHVGQFAGRADALYQLKNSDSLFYAFVIAGAFELQGRLLHERDGLALWDLQEADMEALSNNAVMLVIEMAG